MPPLDRRHQRLTLLTMCVSQGMILVDITIVNVALPTIQHDLHMAPGRLEWVISAYALTLATLIPLGGTLGDRLGRKRVFLAGLLVFTAASAGCALSPSDLVLIGFRVLQGVGGAVMSALTLSILSEAYPKSRRAGAIGVWAAVAGLGFGAGPIVGGLLLSAAGWSSIFWVNVPVGGVGLAVGLAAVPETRDPAHRPLDVGGALLCMTGLFGLTLGLIESQSAGWGSALVTGSLLGGAAALGAFAFLEWRSRHPMVPPSLLARRSFRWCCAAYLLAYAAFTGFFFYVTLLFQDVRGWSALRTGLSWLVMNVPFIVAAQAASPLNRRLGSRRVMALGLGLGAAGVLALGGVGVAGALPLAFAGYVLVGLGFGAFAPAVTNAAMAEVPEGSSGIASGVLNASRQVGTSVGLAVIGTIGTTATLGAWSTRLAGAPAATRSAGHAIGQEVAGGQVAAAAHLGAGWEESAAQAFHHGFALSLAASAAMLAVAAAGVALRLKAPGPSARAPTVRPAAESA